MTSQCEMSIKRRKNVFLLIVQKIEILDKLKNGDTERHLLKRTK
jgi:hypothetical protein